jgi:hypothetical protein
MMLLRESLANHTFSGMSNETCSSYVLATDIYDQARLTNYWCDSITQTGGIIYEVTPDGERLSCSLIGGLDNHHRL